MLKIEEVKRATENILYSNEEHKLKTNIEIKTTQSKKLSDNNNIQEAPSNQLRLSLVTHLSRLNCSATKQNTGEDDNDV